MNNFRLPSPPPLPPGLAMYLPWLAMLICAFLALVFGFTWCWDNVMPLLFHAPTFTAWNSLALLGCLGFTWGVIWLMWASVKESQ